jgi:endoglucanase
MKQILLFTTMLFATATNYATNLVGIKPISNKILDLTFVDGAIHFHDVNETRSNDSVLLFPGGRLSVIDAKIISSYQIMSTNDNNYISPQNPIDIGVNKRIEQTWTLDLEGRPTHVEEIHVYLFLQHALQINKQYTVAVSGASINANVNNFSFVYNTQSIHSESIHVNNIGYAPNAESKFAYVYAWLGDHEYLKLMNDSFITQKPIGVPRTFNLINTQTNTVAYVGNVTFRKSFSQSEFGQWGTNNNNFSLSDVYECDFSSYTTAGTYVVEVEDIGASFPFKIDDNVYYEPLYYTLKNLYENRSGIELHTPFAQYNRPICHKPGVNNFKLFYSKIPHYDLGPSSSDANQADTTIINANITGEINVSGWYQDAGDWDAYWTHSKVPAYLLYLYESNPAVFDTMKLNLEYESSNNLPDVLDEARWLIRFYKQCKDSIQATQHGGTGGVPGGRIFGDNYPTFDGSNPEDGKGSWQDNKRKWVMLGESTHLTYIYAGLSAHLATLLSSNNLTDPENINWQQEALQAWNWANSHTTALSIVPSADYDLVRARIYANAAMYKLTGAKIPYEQQFIYDLDHIPNENSNLSYVGQSFYIPWDTLNPSWVSIGTGFVSNDDWSVLALGNYYKAANQYVNVDNSTKSRIKNILIEGTDFLLGSNAFPGTLQSRACRWGGNWWLPMGIGQGTTPYLNVASLSIPNLRNTSDSNQVKDWIKNMHTTADYFMGCNPINMTMISGIGEKSIHQMFHMDSWYCNSGNDVNVKKGFVSYGPLGFEGADLGGWGGYPAPYRYYYGLNKSYPLPPDRPGHERFMPSRTAPLGNENTIHQTCINAIMTYGTLFALSTKALNVPLELENPIVQPILQTDGGGGTLKIYPNPTSEFFSIQLLDNTSTINLFSMNGSLLKSFKINKDNKYSVMDLCNGIYTIEVITYQGNKYHGLLRKE